MAAHDGFDIEQALRALVESGGSDLHLKVGLPPMMRLHGELTPFEGAPPLTNDDTRNAARRVIVDPAKYEEFADEHEVDFSYHIEGSGRYRFNIFMQRGCISVVSNVAPQLVAGVWDAYAAGDYMQAQKLHYQSLPLADALFLESNPIPVKTALHLM